MREMKDSGIEWIGEIPKGWKVSRIKQLFSEVNDRCENGENYTLLSVSEYYGVAPKSERISDDDMLTHAETLDGYKICNENDLVMNIMLAWKRALGVSEYTGIVSPAYCIYRGKQNMCAKYFHYLFRTDVYANLFKQYSTGIIDSRLRLYPDKFLSLKCQVPPLGVQRRIADYLDRKCNQIDAIIARQQEVIEKLKAYKLSIITEAVTKGLNPDVPMKESGVEWIGKIPEHWQVPKIKYLATIASGGTPDRSHPEYWNGSINWAKTGELQNNELYKTEEKITELALENSSARVFSVDTILVAMYGQGKTRGMTALLKVPSATNQACAGITVYSTDITVSYLWLFLMGAYDAIREKANGSGQPNLSSALIADFNVTLPPIEEQMHICKTVAMRLPNIDHLIERKKTIIDKLTDYKKSLIYEVVTGKKEV